MSRTLVVSIDALFTADIPRLRALPNLGRVMEKASWAEDVLCVYPTLTYPCHATIVTGCYPDRHGIHNNEKPDWLAPGRPDWFWYRRDIRTPTVIDAARAAGLTTATVTWPVMCASGADYNIGEIWAPREEDDPTPWFTPANSPAAAPIFEANKHLLRWMKTPQMDEFAARCAADIIRGHRPDLMLLHLSYVDHQRHRHGIHAPALDGAFRFVDEQLGFVLDALEETGGLAGTNLVLLGDHGQLPCHRMLHLNTLFRDLGWLTEANGAVTDYRVYAASCSLSAHIYLAPGVDPQTVHRGLRELQARYPDCIERIFTREEAAALRLAGPFDFVLEAGPGVTFTKDPAAPAPITSVNDQSAFKPSVASHGHLPEKGERPPFIVSGPDAKRGAVVRGARLVDEAPTILALLGLEAQGMDGVPLDLVAR